MTRVGAGTATEVLRTPDDGCGAVWGEDGVVLGEDEVLTLGHTVAVGLVLLVGWVVALGVYDGWDKARLGDGAT
jgi:hypothetical protein